MPMQGQPRFVEACTSQTPRANVNDRLELVAVAAAGGPLVRGPHDGLPRRSVFGEGAGQARKLQAGRRQFEPGRALPRSAGQCDGPRRVGREPPDQRPGPGDFQERMLGRGGRKQPDEAGLQGGRFVERGVAAEPPLENRRQDPGVGAVRVGRPVGVDVGEAEHVGQGLYEAFVVGPVALGERAVDIEHYELHGEKTQQSLLLRRSR
jgi:hypothetical protein